MAKVILIASKLPRMGSRISKTFKNSRVDIATNRVIYFQDLDFEIQEVTNTVSNNLGGFVFTVHHIDLDKVIRHNKDKMGTPLSIGELLEGIKECLGSEWEGGGMKIIVKPEYSKELKKLVDAKLIGPTNLIGDKILEKIVINVDPVFDDYELGLEDDDVESLDDIRKKVVAVKAKKKEEVEGAVS
jgi:hypothetical protein